MRMIKKVLKTGILGVLMLAMVVISSRDTGIEPGSGTDIQFDTFKQMAAYPLRQNSPFYDSSKSDKAKADKIPVITYHFLASDKEKAVWYNFRSGLVVSERVFDDQMKWLKDHGYRTLSMDEFYRWHSGEIELPEKSVVITFDDGAYSVIKYGLPILKKYKMKATMFMIGEYTSENTCKYPTSQGRYKATGLDEISRVKDEYPNLEFQGHTYRMHRKKNDTPYVHILNEEQQSLDLKKEYEKYGYEYLAYPYGEYTDGTIEAAKKNHIKMAFIYGNDRYATREQNPFAIERIKINGARPMGMFYRWFKE